MYAIANPSDDDIKFVLDNLCNDTIVELNVMLGHNYKKIIFEQISSANNSNIVNIIKLKSSNLPVGLFGLIPLNNYSNELNSNSSSRAAGIFLLTTDNLHDGNIITLLKGAKKQIELWLNDYELIMDKLFKQNRIIKKWLRLLGFTPSAYEDQYFQIYYKGNIDSFNIGNLYE